MRTLRYRLIDKTEDKLLHKYNMFSGIYPNGKRCRGGIKWCKTWEDYENVTELIDPEEDEERVIRAFLEM